jgi:hypothetical protein
VEAVARRVAELIRTESDHHAARRLVDAATLAAELGVERSWVYAHRDELGAIQLGTGSKPRLRFDPAIARSVLAHSASTGSHEPKTPAPPTARTPASAANGQRLGIAADSWLRETARRR